MSVRITTALCSLGLAAAALATTFRPGQMEFEELSIHLEVNATDGDGEVILHAETGQPLERVAVVAPDGRVVQQLDASTPGGIGLSEVRLESGEPGLAALYAAYPEGSYLVRARALDGTLITGTAVLSHELPARWQLSCPERPIGRDELVIAWTAGPEVEQLTVEVVDEDGDQMRMSATPPPGGTSVRVPSELLEPDHEYQVVARARATNGNELLQERYVRTEP